MRPSNTTAVRRAGLLALACVLASACHRGRGATAAAEAPDSPSADAAVPVARRVPVELTLDHPSVAITDQTLPFTLRLTNPGRRAVRIDFTGEPLYPRGPKDKVRVPALWYSIEHDARASGAGSLHYDFATRDTVLAPGQVMEVRWEHQMAELGLNPGTYRMRAGIGAHASPWVTFVVKQ